MSGNSLESLLARMRQGSVTQGWGAVSIFSRGRLNRLLEQQYIERFNGFGFLPPLSGQVFLNELQSHYVELENITLGQPRLSFNTASLTNSTAVLTMNILSGRYTASRQAAGALKTLSSTFTVAESQGFNVEMDIDLSMVVGEIDKQGRVKLNLAEGVNFRCNLAGDDEATNLRLSGFLRQCFAALPAHRSVFQLGMLELKGHNPLTPTSFHILTQAAPGAKVRGASNFGEGGVVIFIRLQGNTVDGRFPPDGSFPYLLPDDQETDGSDRYTAALILSQAMIPHIEDNRLDVLNNLLFPGDNVFEERERHVPADLAVFGNINPKRTRITLEPTFQTIQAGGTQRFRLLDWNGTPIQASSWKAVSLQSHTAAGHGRISDGLYTAASANTIGHESLHVVVTAEYIAGDETYTASALLLVVYESVTVAPSTAVYSTRAQSQPIVLKASTADATGVTWTPLAPLYGALTPEGHQATFTPDTRSRAKGLAVQQIEVAGTQTRRLALVLQNAQQQLRIDPAYVPAVQKSVAIQLRDDTTLLPSLPRRWKVISGAGQVSSTGQFTASAQGPASSTVVQCEIVSNGVVLSSGYSVVDLSELEPEPSWKALSEFTVTVPGGREQGRYGQLYANGYQQLRAEIVVGTVPVNGVEYPLSVTEKASLKLVDDVSGDEIEPVEEPLDGIAESDSEKWRSRLVENRFELAEPWGAVQDASPSAAISRQEIYLHSRERGNAVKAFHVKFQADSDQRWWKSTDFPGEVNSKIHVTPQAIPQFQPSDYLFERVRVSGGSAGPGGDPEDDFDFHLRTVDYWTLRYVGGTLPGVAFETLEFVSVDGSDIYLSPQTSTIRWESEQLAETMFSWTGYIFDDPLKEEVVDKVKFDSVLKEVVKERDESLDIRVDQSNFAKGLLVITLHRSDRIPYIRRGNNARDKLSRDLAVILIDKRGNPHRRRISFLPPSTVGDRNRLVHTEFTP
ncbi:MULTISPECIES: hypothetical protein [Pseudomonas]|uniref:hypothetical protein n=1 Tax=Pseudomonas TaxID=286 RepID=UPI001BEC9C68|nr:MULTISPECIES: hypothetical protein [Pseudomonas]MBT2341798.1 hypothetical protein [Pseudomonas fluorescens]MCD4530469.1 hypothetical protein [Pseudomonas sp. C3-2018]